MSCWDVGLLDLGMVHMGFICLRLMTQGLVHTGDTLGIWSSIWLWNTFNHYVWVEFSEITISNSYNWSFRAIETDNDWIFLVYLCFGQLVCTTASLCTNLAPSDSSTQVSKPSESPCTSITNLKKMQCLSTFFKPYIILRQ